MTTPIHGKRMIIDRIVDTPLPSKCNRIEVMHAGSTIVINARPFERDPASKDLCILKKARVFFAHASHFELVKPIVSEDNCAVSLRILDFLVTNYSKRHHVSYMHNCELVMVYHLYKSALRAYSKRSFDAFCRRERILFKIDNHPTILTTPAQLNFLMWCVRYGVIAYAEANKLAIETDMAKCAKSRRGLPPAAPPVPAGVSISICTR